MSAADLYTLCFSMFSCLSFRIVYAYCFTDIRRVCIIYMIL